jgi:hypothetical protein
VIDFGNGASSIPTTTAVATRSTKTHPIISPDG